MVKFARPSVGEDMILLLPVVQPGGRFCFLPVFSFFEKLNLLPGHQPGKRFSPTHMGLNMLLPGGQPGKRFSPTHIGRCGSKPHLPFGVSKVW